MIQLCSDDTTMVEAQYTLYAYLNTWEPTTPPGMCQISELNDACRSAEHRGACLFKHLLLFSVIRHTSTFEW